MDVVAIIALRVPHATPYYGRKEPAVSYTWGPARKLRGRRIWTKDEDDVSVHDSDTEEEEEEEDNEEYEEDDEEREWLKQPEALEDLVEIVVLRRRGRRSHALICRFRICMRARQDGCARRSL